MKNSKLLVAFSLALACSGAALAADGGPARGACKDDVTQLCKGIKPGGGRIAACLKEHKEQVSDACKAAIKEARAAHKADKAGGKPGDDSGTKDE